MTDSRLIEVILDDGGKPAPTPEVEQERKVAIFDLLEENQFAPAARGEDKPLGPFALTLSVADGRLTLDVKDTPREETAQIILSLSPLRQVIKDYFQICEAYFEAVKNLPPRKSKQSIWGDAASTTRAHACSPNASKARSTLIMTPPAAFSP